MQTFINWIKSFFNSELEEQQDYLEERDCLLRKLQRMKDDYKSVDGRTSKGRQLKKEIKDLEQEIEEVESLINNG